MRGPDEIPALYFFLFSYVAGLLLSEAGLFLLPLAALTFCRKKALKGIGWCAVVLFLGAFAAVLREPGHDPDHYLNVGLEKYLFFEICDEPEERNKTFRAQGRMLGTGDDTLWRRCNGLVRLYFRKDSSMTLPRCGDRVVALADVRPIEGFTGKDGKYFDYAAFMAKRRVYGQVFLDRENFRVEASRPSPVVRIRRGASRLRGNLRRFWEQCGLRPDELAVAKALVLGERGDDSVEEAYRKSGVIHVLAVSGMHLSIFSCLLASALAFLGRKSWQRWLRFSIVLSFVWAYALLTGLSPSACRAACMFSFVGLGDCLGRKGRSVRSLAVSALFLLLVDPGLLHDAGFLLSYAAVAGLIFLSPVLGKIWKPSGKIPRFFRNLAVASVSAQLATLPAGLFLFGTFPTYFLIGNCLVAPLVNIALPFGIAVTALSFVWKAAAVFLAGVFGLLVRCMNRMAMIIRDWPSAMVDLSITLVAAVSLYGAIACLWRAFSRGSAASLRMAMILLLVSCWTA